MPFFGSTKRKKKQHEAHVFAEQEETSNSSSYHSGTSACFHTPSHHASGHKGSRRGRMWRKALNSVKRNKSSAPPPCKTDQIHCRLLEFAGNGDVKGVSSMLHDFKNPVNVDFQDECDDDFCALSKAVQHGHVDAVRALLDGSASTELRTRDDGLTPLMIAAKGGMVEICQILLRGGANTSAINHGGHSALALARRYEHDTVVDMLQSRPKRILDTITALGTHDSVECSRPAYRLSSDERATERHLARDIGRYVAKTRALLQHDGTTKRELVEMLQQACITGRVPVVELLLQHVDVNASDARGVTPLHCAALYGNTRMIHYLLDRGADSRKKTVSGNTPLAAAALKKHKRVVDLLRAHGDKMNLAKAAYRTIRLTPSLDVNSFTDENGASPLLLAAERGLDNVVHLLVERGAEVDRADSAGCTALIAASREGHRSCVAFLVHKKAKLSSKDTQGRTALHYAAYYGHADCVRELVSAGAEVDSRSEYGATPLWLAVQEGSYDCVKALLKCGAQAATMDKFDWSALMKTSEQGDSRIAKLLLKACDADHVNCTNKSNATALILAAQNGHASVCRLLFSHGASVNDRDKLGYSALWYAVHWMHKDVALLLLVHGANACVPCMKEVQQSRNIVVWVAENRGTKWCAVLDGVLTQTDNLLLNSITKDGHSALSRAAASGNASAVKLLLRRGALQPRPGDTSMVSPVASAQAAGYDAIVDRLEEAYGQQKAFLSVETSNLEVSLFHSRSRDCSIGPERLESSSVLRNIRRYLGTAGHHKRNSQGSARSKQESSTVLIDADPDESVARRHSPMTPSRRLFLSRQHLANNSKSSLSASFSLSVTVQRPVSSLAASVSLPPRTPSNSSSKRVRSKSICITPMPSLTVPSPSMRRLSMQHASMPHLSSAGAEGGTKVRFPPPLLRASASRSLLHDDDSDAAGATNRRPAFPSIFQSRHAHSYSVPLEQRLVEGLGTSPSASLCPALAELDSRAFANADEVEDGDTGVFEDDSDDDGDDATDDEAEFDALVKWMDHAVPLASLDRQQSS